WAASTTPKSVPPTQPTTPPNAQPRRIPLLLKRFRPTCA
ncbi:hypothetical protein, partial [Arthrobacter sp. DR-2P]